MAVSLKTDLRFPESGQHGHGSRIIQYYRVCKRKRSSCMIVYHGATDIIKKPDVFHSKRYLDFGKGFYITF